MNKRNLIFVLVFFLALSACAPTSDLIPIETVFAATHSALMAQTEAARARETATPIPTNTRRPTLTPIPSSTTFVLTPTFTPTVTLVPTATQVTSGSGNVLYSCNIRTISPTSGYIAKPNERIRWTWYVENMGTTKWWPKTMVAAYSSGAEHYVDKEIALEDPTDVGETGIFSVRLIAPKEPGTYTTTWSLKKGIHYFCYTKLVIVVKK